MSVKIRIEFDTINDAFDRDPMNEATLIINSAIEKLRDMPVDSTENLYDTNGNRVGSISTLIN